MNFVLKKNSRTPGQPTPVPKPLNFNRFKNLRNQEKIKQTKNQPSLGEQNEGYPTHNKNNQEQRKKFGANFFTNLNIEQINKGSKLTKENLELVKKAQSEVKYRDMDYNPAGRRLALLQKKIYQEDQSKKNDPYHRELSPNNYKFRADADKEVDLSLLFKEPNDHYRRIFYPNEEDLDDNETDESRIYPKPLYVNKKYSDSFVKATKLQRFNSKYKGNYEELEVFGYKGIFTNPKYNPGRKKPSLVRRSGEFGGGDRGEGIKKMPGGVGEIIAEKYRRLNEQRSGFVREGWMNGHRYNRKITTQSKAQISINISSNRSLLPFFVIFSIFLNFLSFLASNEEIERYREGSERRGLNFGAIAARNLSRTGSISQKGEGSVKSKKSVRFERNYQSESNLKKS